jgi:hypothetical protein
MYNDCIYTTSDSSHSLYGYINKYAILLTIGIIPIYVTSIVKESIPLI